jgi:hypothetical protein
MDCRVKPGNDTAFGAALCVSNYALHFFVQIGSTAGFTT